MDNGGRAFDLDDAMAVALGPVDDRFRADRQELRAFFVAEIGACGDFSCISKEAARAGTDAEDGRTALTANLAAAFGSDRHEIQEGRKPLRADRLRESNPLSTSNGRKNEIASTGFIRTRGEPCLVSSGLTAA